MTNLEDNQGDHLKIDEFIKHGYIMKVKQTTVHQPPATDIWKFEGEIVGEVNN